MQCKKKTTVGIETAVGEITRPRPVGNNKTREAQGSIVALVGGGVGGRGEGPLLIGAGTCLGLTQN